MFLGELTNTASIFWFCAIAGTLIFVIRIILSFMGIVGIEDVSDVHHFDSDSSYSIVSINSISSFLAMFGWSGLAAHVQMHYNSIVSVLIASIIGLVTMAVTAYLLKMILKLTNPGEKFTVESSMGLIGNVYQQIPAEGLGVIQVNVNGLTRELQACSEAKSEIASFSRVKIVRVVDSNTVSVEIV